MKGLEVPPSAQQWLFGKDGNPPGSCSSWQSDQGGLGSAGWGALQSPRSQEGAASGCSPGLSLGPLHSGSGAYSFCGDTLEALRETVYSCFFDSVPDSLLSCSLLFQEHSHACINNAYVEAPHIKGRASGPVTFADCPFLMVPSRKATSQALSSQPALSDLMEP